MAEKLHQPIVTATITKRVDLFGESSGEMDRAELKRVPCIHFLLKHQYRFYC